MRSIVISISVIFMLFVTPSAGAALPSDAPPTVPRSFCSAYDATKCYSAEPTDTYAAVVQIGTPKIWVKTNGQRGFSTSTLGCTTIAYPPIVLSGPGQCNAMYGKSVQHVFERRHKYQWKYAWLHATVMTFEANDGVSTFDTRYPLFVDVYQGFNKPFCAPDPTNPYVTTGAEGIPYPTADAPADYVAVCYPTKPTAVHPPDGGGSTSDPDHKPDVTKPCPLITVGARKAKVVTVNLGCALGRNTIAKYLRTGKEAPGWVCVKVRMAKTAVGKCVREGSARGKRPTVTGTYRVR